MVEGADFVRLVMDALGVQSPSQLAETMSWKRGTERLVAKWLSGQNDPSYTYTMEMLDRVGWLAIGDAGASPATDQRGADAAFDQALEEIAGVLERLVSRVSEQELPSDAAKQRPA
jgi:hypothetical protein